MDILYGLLAIVLLPFILIWLKPNCPKCNKKVYASPEEIDREYVDTTPTRKDGQHDERYKKSGYDNVTQKYTCKCGHSWTDVVQK